ncbi:MAG: alpha-1,2-fucosyltransferase [Candidatus Pacebacteria bacterium]|nr:alpha-1,2-fucosyltransferase [Candidatus Paceibacterota bacterium]
MIIVRLKGGLGNQMLQYAAGKAAALRCGSQLKLDVSNLYSKITNDTPRFYELDAFKLEAEIATEKELQKINPPFKKLFRKIFRKITGKNYLVCDPDILKARDNSYLEVVWPCEKYFADFREQIFSDFQLKKPLSQSGQSIKEKILKSKNSISIHLRRGDYASHKTYKSWHGLCSPSYYQKAVDYILNETKAETKKAPVVFVFSDEIEWAKNNLILPAELTEIVYVSDEKIPAYEEIHLMSLCHHHVIANSTFSWWGAWLDPKSAKIVVAPRQWVADSSVDTKDVLPNTWVSL